MPLAKGRIGTTPLRTDSAHLCTEGNYLEFANNEDTDAWLEQFAGKRADIQPEPACLSPCTSLHALCVAIKMLPTTADRAVVGAEDVVTFVKAKDAAAAAAAQQEMADQDEQPKLSDEAVQDCKRRLIRLLQPGENVLAALRRLGLTRKQDRRAAKVGSFCN